MLATPSLFGRTRNRRLQCWGRQVASGTAGRRRGHMPHHRGQGLEFTLSAGGVLQASAGSRVVQDTSFVRAQVEERYSTARMRRCDRPPRGSPTSQIVSRDSRPLLNIPCNFRFVFTPSRTRLFLNFERLCKVDREHLFVLGDAKLAKRSQTHRQDVVGEAPTNSFWSLKNDRRISGGTLL